MNLAGLNNDPDWLYLNLEFDPRLAWLRVTFFNRGTRTHFVEFQQTEPSLALGNILLFNDLDERVLPRNGHIARTARDQPILLPSGSHWLLDLQGERTRRGIRLATFDFPVERGRIYRIAFRYADPETERCFQSNISEWMESF